MNRECNDKKPRNWTEETLFFFLWVAAIPVALILLWIIVDWVLLLLGHRDATTITIR